jgi:hypothetical protein
MTLASVVYGLCLLASLACAGLLWRAYQSSRTRLLLWTAIGFGLLALNNLALVADQVVFPEVDLTPARQITSLAAVCVLLYGFVWEVER